MKKNEIMSKTKIVCTVGPASESKEMLTKLVKAGMNVMRLNFSHGTHEEHAEKITTLLEINKELSTNVAILLDTKGPEIRTGDFVGGKTTFKKGQTSIICVEDIEGTSERFTITYKDLYKDVKPGGFILVNDGQVELLVDHVEGTDIVCICANDGVVKNKRGINVPGIKLGFDYLSEKDIGDLTFGCQQGVDFIAASFVRRPQDVLDVKKLLIENGRPEIQIIAKIENSEGVENMDEILKVADGIMVARGDLGVEIPAEDVPLIQKELINKCRAAGKIVITATQMLDSMQENPRPTRAEVSDVANAIYDGTDAIMLSGESAQGKYPVEAVKMMNQIAISTEVHLSTKIKDYRSKYINRGISAAVAYSAVQTAHNVNAKCILASSMSGFTTRIVSKFKPDAQIIGLSPDDAIVRQMQIYWGVRPFKSHKAETTKDLLDEATDIVLDAGLAEKDDILVLTGGGPANHRGKGVTNMLKVVKIGEFGE